MVALASLVHQIRAATTATTAAIAAAATTSPLVRRSGLSIRRTEPRPVGVRGRGLARATATTALAGVRRLTAFGGRVVLGGCGLLGRRLRMPGDLLARRGGAAGCGGG